MNKQLQTRLAGLERSVTVVVEKISSLKEENEKLSAENNRLHTELNQLRKSSEGRSFDDDLRVGNKLATSKRDINVGHFKEELDRCIEEIEHCLRHL